MNMLKKKFLVYLTILGIFFACGFYVKLNSYINAATPALTSRLSSISTLLATPTPTRRRENWNITTFYIEKVSDASEQGIQQGQFRLWSTQEGPVTGDGYIKVNYTISGTATNGTDYQTIPGYVYVKIGMFTQPLPTTEPRDYIYIKPLADNLTEGTETVTITLTGVTVGAGKGSATLNITDSVSNITPTPTPTTEPTPTPTPRRATPTPTGGIILNPTIPPGVTITFYVQASGDAAEPPIGGSYGTPGNFKFWSTQTGPTTSEGYFKVNYTVSGTASNADYTMYSPMYSSLPGYIWVKVGNSPAPPLPTDTLIDSATIRPVRDNLVEGTETLIVTLTGVNVGPGQGSATLNILDANSATTPTPTPPVSVTPTPTSPRVITVTPTPTPTPRPGGYAVSYAVQSDWGNGATVSVTITNNSTATVNGWTLAWTFSGNQTITNLWNGTCTQNGASVSVKDSGYNANIPAGGGSVNFGFNLNYSGSNLKPTSFTLNGTPCAVQ